MKLPGDCVLAVIAPVPATSLCTFSANAKTARLNRTAVHSCTNVSLMTIYDDQPLDFFTSGERQPIVLKYFVVTVRFTARNFVGARVDPSVGSDSDLGLGGGGFPPVKIVLRMLRAMVVSEDFRFPPASSPTATSMESTSALRAAEPALRPLAMVTITETITTPMQMLRKLIVPSEPSEAKSTSAQAYE